MIKLSVIVPCYKVENYLARCMQSLQNQSLQDIEIILINDGSPDTTPRIIDEYAQSDSRIKVIHKKNEGLGYARNSGLDMAKGDYIAFIDSDDYIDLNMLKVLYTEAINSHADVVYSGFYIEQSPGTWNKSQEVNQRTEWTDSNINDFILNMIASAPYISTERKYQMSVWHSIYRRSIIEQSHIRFLSERNIGSEDIPFQIDFLLKSKKIVYIPEALYYYCNNEKSLTSTYKSDMFDRYKKLFHVLQLKTQNIPNAQERIDRLFIGYSRYCISHLSLNRDEFSKKLLTDIIYDPIWNEISSRYKPSFLPPYQRLFYWSIIHKRTNILNLLCKTIRQIKKLLNNRNN